jgi:hypothetical protein
LKRLLNPIFILPFFYFFIVLYTTIGITVFDYAKEVPFHLNDMVENQSIQIAISNIIFAAFSFLMGALLIKNNAEDRSIGFINTVHYKLIKIKSFWILFIYFIVIILLHIGYSPSLIYYKEGYTIGNNGSAMFRILYTLLLPFSMILLPLLNNKLIRWFLLIILILLVLGTSSRQIILIPLFYFIGNVFRVKKVSVIGVILAVSSIVFLLNAMINLRDYEIQGAIPNILHLVNGEIDFSLIFYAINYLFSYSIFASAYTIQEFIFDSRSFYYAITPLTLSYIDVNYMVETQKLNQYSPFPAISFLSLGGMNYIFIYFFITGLIWSFVLKYFFNTNILIYFLIIVLLIIFTFLSTQYNLRGITRLTYYILFIYISYRIIWTIIPKKTINKKGKK